MPKFAKNTKNTKKKIFNKKNDNINIKKINYSDIFKSNLTDINDTNDTNDTTEINDEISSDNFCCSYCQKKFSTKYTLSRHLNEVCKIKKENDTEKEKIFKLLLDGDKENKERINQLEKQNILFEKQNKMLMDKIDKLINMKNNLKPSKIINNNQKITNNTQNNNTNNFVMVNFGKEDLSIIDERLFIDKIIKKNTISGVKIPDEVLKIIHFNPLYPQLSNIYISDINREKCMVYEDGEWILSNIDNVPLIMDKICLFSTDQINNLREKHPNNKVLNDRLNTIEKYNNMIDEDYIQDLKDNENTLLIKRCEDFKKNTYNTLKKTLYNGGKKIKKILNK